MGVLPGLGESFALVECPDDGGAALGLGAGLQVGSAMDVGGVPARGRPQSVVLGL